MSMKYIRDYYGVPAKRHQRITYEGAPGIITGTSGPHLRVRIDGIRGRFIVHPTDDNLAYVDEPKKPKEGTI